jgi:hypothetical protein
MRALKSSTLASVAVLGLVLAACGSKSHPQQRSKPSKPPASSASARRLEHALLAAGPPRPKSASCRPATAADRRASPVGASPSPVFSCVIDVAGTKAPYYVQVLKTGCFVAERRRVGRAIYGCGAG